MPYIHYHDMIMPGSKNELIQFYFVRMKFSSKFCSAIFKFQLVIFKCHGIYFDYTLTPSKHLLFGGKEKEEKVPKKEKGNHIDRSQISLFFDIPSNGKIAFHTKNFYLYTPVRRHQHHSCVGSTF